MRLFQFKDNEAYRKSQELGNARKIGNVWAREGDIEMLSAWLRENVPGLRFGICHGTRRGKEQEWFRKHLGIDVIGTEIASTANQFPHTIQWDFHDAKDEWINAVDFVYSNSFDHSHSPQQCLDTWMACVRGDGVCIIEWTQGHAKGGNRFDPFEEDKPEYEALFLEKYAIRARLPGIRQDRASVHFVLGHK